MLKIGILEGDDIGLEVVPETVKVKKAAAAVTGLAIEWQPLPIGRKGHESHGHTMPAVTVEALAHVDGWLQGPIGHTPIRATTRPGSIRRSGRSSSCSRA